MVTIRKKLPSAMFILALSLPSPAFAVCDGCVVGAIQAATAAITAAIGTTTTALGQILLVLQQGFSQMSAQADKTMAVQQQIENGKIVNEEIRRVQIVKGEVERKMRPPPFPCQTIGAGVQLASSEENAKYLSAALSKKLTDRGLNSKPVAAATEIYADHTKKYAPGTGSKNMPNADIEAASLLGERTYNPDQLEAARYFVRNVTDPIPLENLPKGWEKTDQGRAYLTGQYLRSAQMSIAQHSLAEMVAARTPQPGAGAAAGLARADASALEIGLSEIDKRIKLSEWKKQIMRLPDVLPVLKELVVATGVQLWVDAKQFQQMERIEAIMATQLAMDIRRDSDASLNAQRELAVKAYGRRGS